MVKIIGVVKWFDIVKGYGFITPHETNLPDILFHVDTLKQKGFLSVPKGAKVTCFVKITKQGLQCVEVKEVEVSPTLDYANILEPAIVKWFNYKKGFGFLIREKTGEDIFLHIEVLRQFALTHFVPGQKVLVNIDMTSKGGKVIEIYPASLKTSFAH